MKAVSMRGNKVLLSLSAKDSDALFRIGLQLLLDREHGRKVVVLPVGAVKLGKKAKTIKINDEFERLCIQEAANQALREYLGKPRKPRHRKPING